MVGCALMAKKSANKIERQIEKAGLPSGGAFPFVPDLVKDKAGRDIIRKEIVRHGPRKGKRGYLDSIGRIWIKDHAHAGYPDHWDVQEDGGKSYFRVGFDGNLLP
jgi:hypothetical protein